MTKITNDVILSDGINSLRLLRAIGDRLEACRATMRTGLNLPEPKRYVSASVGQVGLLCDEIETLTIALVLKARGLTNEADEALAEDMVEGLEDIICGGTVNTCRH